MKGKTIGLLQPVYMPWLGFFEQIHYVDLFVILDDVQYTKRAWRNRNRIRTKKGWNWLTVPVYQKSRSKQLIREAEIDNTKKWAHHHWNCLCENYYHSNYWTYYSPFFSDLFQKKWKYLIDLDMGIIYFCIKALGIDTKIVPASHLNLGEKYKEHYGNTGNPTVKNIFYIKELGGDRFYEGALGKNYLDVNSFSKADIKLLFQDYNHPVYEQRFMPFIPYLSIVDLLFNHGPRSLDIILNKTGSTHP